MKHRIYISDIASHKDQEVTLHGWVYNKRSSGKIKFLIIRDGTGMIQGILSQGECEESALKIFDELTQESSIKVKGIVREFKNNFELSVKSIDLIHKTVDYPITPKEHGTDFLMDRRHLWLRSSRQHAILKIRSELIKACPDYFDRQTF